jgi:tRNA(fMet)-specific endonuclease VapC
MFYLLDTDIFSLYLRGHPNVFRSVVGHQAADLGLSIVSIEELWSGWWTPIRRAKTPDRTAVAYQQLTETMDELRNWVLVSFSEPALRRYDALKRQKLNVGGNDLRIAAIALELSAVVVTRNARDFNRVGGLTLEDWSV